MNGQIFIAQLAEKFDKIALQIGLALIARLSLPFGNILRQNGTLIRLRDDIIRSHIFILNSLIAPLNFSMLDIDYNSKSNHNCKQNSKSDDNIEQIRFQ